MTQEQAAKEAVQKAELDRIWDNFVKGVALNNHKVALGWVRDCNIPYKVGIDLLPLPSLEEHQRNENIILPSLIYPAAGWSSDQRVPISYYDCIEGTFTPTQKALDDIWDKIPHGNWDLLTADGLAKWEKLFACFLIGYDFDRFTVFDMWGDVKHTAAELTDRRAYYKAIQGRYDESKGYKPKQRPTEKDKGLCGLPYYIALT